MLFDKQKLKLIYSISVALILGFLVTSFSSYFVSRSSLRSEISLNELPLTSDNIYSEIQRDLLRPVFISSLMANDTFLRDWVIDGEVEEQHITKYLNEIQIKYNTFTSFFVSEKTKKYYHSEGIIKKISPDEERDLWYYRVREMKDNYEINTDPDLTNKDAMTIFINYKVFDYNGNFIGATGVGLTVDAVKKLIEIYQKKYNCIIYFINRNGDIKITGSDFDNTINNISQFKNLSFFEDILSTQSESSFSYKKNGHMVHTNIRYIDEFEWLLVVEQSEQKAIKHILRTLIINLIICVVVIFIVLLLVNLSITAYQKKIETLRGIVPICMHCKGIRDDKGYWNQLEEYISEHSEVQFSHGICEKCLIKYYPDEEN